MKRFDGRVAFVVGGGHGIGRATALRLADEGASIAAGEVDSESADAVVAELTERGTDAAAYPCDVGSRGSVDAAIAGAAERFGRLDVLVVTSGGQQRDFEDLTDDGWAEQLDHSLTGVVRCFGAALPHLIESPVGAAVAIGSVNGLAAFGGGPYAAAKAGLGNLVQNLASRHGPDGVRFNLVAPGTVRTRVWDGRDDEVARFQRFYPLGRIGEPDDIAAAVAFLASDDAAWITGVTLPVEGGILTGPAHQF